MIYHVAFLFNNTKNRPFILYIMVRLSYSIRILEKKL